MATSTLHLNNPVPSNGAVVSSLGGRHTVTVTLAGVGSISCVVQAWGSEQGTDARKIGAPVTISGTTTVSQTLTFDADCKQFWLQLVSMSPACKFNATVENNGSYSLSGPLVAPGILSTRSLATMWKNYWIPSQQTNTSPGVTASSLITESTGLIGADANYNVSAPIPVTPGEVVIFANDQQVAISPNKGGFYGADGTTWIGGVHAKAINNGHKTLFKVPAGAYFVRFNVSRSTNPVYKYWCGRRRTSPLLSVAEKITFCGDSITAGSTTYFDKTYPQVITEMTGIPHENTAVGGRKISGASTGLHVDIKGTDHTATIGVMLGGVNDYLTNVVLGAADSSNTAEFNGALNAMGSYLVNGRPWQKWYWVTPLPQNSANPNSVLGLPLRDYCDAMIAAGLRYGITVLDANKDLGMDIRQTFQGWMYSGDGLHLNWLSTDLMAMYIMQQISTR